MSDLDDLSVSRRDFNVRAAREGDALRVQFSGSADLDAREPVDALLARLHAELLRSRAEDVIVDFLALEFMNSSCLKSFVTWLGQAQDLPPEERYRVRFRSNPALLWQRRSLQALRCLAPELVTIEP